MKSLSTNLRDRVDILMALPHLAVEQDTMLAQQFPQIDLIWGGHEHHTMAVVPGPGLALIYEAGANARTAYIHILLSTTFPFATI